MKRRTLLSAGLQTGVLGTAGSLASCTLAPDHDFSAADAPGMAALSRPPRTAWVFSSGGPRGFVHVGVIKALSELGLKPDLLVGASVGALVAVLYGSGRSAANIEHVALDLQPFGLGRLAMGSNEWFSGSAIADLVRSEIKGLPLERMLIPVACVAARKRDGQAVGFTSGDAGLAVQASCAIEGQFTPVRIRGDQYVDADQYQPLPVRLARQLGATRILAIDASAHENKAPSGASGYLAGDLRKRALTEPDSRLADVALHPDFGYYVNLTREFRQRAIEAGYRSTLAAAPKLLALHSPS